MERSEPVSPRRLTGHEEAELLKAAQVVERAEEDVARANAALDALISDLDADGARMTDIADVLNVSRTTAYTRRDRAR
jgi:hypothetical protein